LDKDDDGSIDFTDFIVCFSITSFGDLEKKVVLAFNIYDLGKGISFLISKIVKSFTAFVLVSLAYIINIIGGVQVRTIVQKTISIAQSSTRF